MSRIAIYASLGPNLDPGARWEGNVDWPGSPRRGDTWYHCEDWAGETVERVEFFAPVRAGKPALAIEVRTTEGVVQHLVDMHGFNDMRGFTR